MPAADDQARALLLRSLPAARRAQRAPKPPPPRPEERTGSRGPRESEQRPGRAAPCPATNPGLPVPTAASPTGTAALTGPAPPTRERRRPRSCCGQSAAKRRPQLRPNARALAPPIVKGPAGGSAYKASAGHMRTRRCQSRLAIQPGHPESSNRRPGRAGAAPGGGLGPQRDGQHLWPAPPSSLYRRAPTPPTAAGCAAGRVGRGAPEKL